MENILDFVIPFLLVLQKKMGFRGCVVVGGKIVDANVFSQGKLH